MDCRTKNIKPNYDPSLKSTFNQLKLGLILIHPGVCTKTPGLLSRQVGQSLPTPTRAHFMEHFDLPFSRQMFAIR